MTNKKIKELYAKENKKIGKLAIKKINNILEKDLEKMIKKSAKNADFAGRKIILSEDINE